MSLRASEDGAADDAVEQPFVGQEPADGAEEAVVGDRVRVLVRVRHAREELHLGVALGIRPDDVTDLADPVVRGAHERAYALVVGDVEHLHDRVDVLEAHLLRPGLLLRHVVDAEELVVAEEQPVHHPRCWVRRSSAGPSPYGASGRGCAPAEQPGNLPTRAGWRTSAPRWAPRCDAPSRSAPSRAASSLIAAITRSVTVAEAKSFSPSVLPAITRWTKASSCALYSSPRR